MPEDCRFDEPKDQEVEMSETPNTKRTMYTKREIILSGRTIERIERQAHDRSVSFDAMAEAMLREVLEDLEQMYRPDARFTESFDRRVQRMYEEIEEAKS